MVATACLWQCLLGGKKALGKSTRRVCWRRRFQSMENEKFIDQRPDATSCLQSRDHAAQILLDSKLLLQKKNNFLQVFNSCKKQSIFLRVFYQEIFFNLHTICFYPSPDMKQTDVIHTRHQGHQILEEKSRN